MKSIMGKDWMNFLKGRKAFKDKKEPLDKLFVRDYKNVYKMFYKIIKYEK